MNFLIKSDETVQEHIREAQNVIEAMTPGGWRTDRFRGFIYDPYHVKGFQNKYGEYREVWPFSNEPLKDIYQDEDLKNKKVLTIAGSGDHALTAVLCGATEIDTFDINKLAEYIMGLKIAAIKGLSFEEFWKVFDISYKMNHNAMIELYGQISSFLPADIKTFWDYFYNQEKIESLKYLFFSHQDLERCMVEGRIPYMQNARFEELKERIDDTQITFISSDLQFLPSKVTSRYGHINLSNILTCFGGEIKSEYTIKNIQAINALKSSLQEGGNMFCTYWPSIQSDSSKYESLLDASTQIFTNSIETLNGDRKSKILIYKK